VLALQRIMVGHETGGAGTKLGQPPSPGLKPSLRMAEHNWSSFRGPQLQCCQYLVGTWLALRMVTFTAVCALTPSSTCIRTKVTWWVNRIFLFVVFVQYDSCV